MKFLIEEYPKVMGLIGLILIILGALWEFVFLAWAGLITIIIGLIIDCRRMSAKLKREEDG